MYVEYRYTYHNLTPEDALDFLATVTESSNPVLPSTDDYSYINYIVPNVYTNHTEFTEDTTVVRPNTRELELAILLPQSNLRVVDSTEVKFAEDESFDYPLKLEGEPIIVGDCKNFRILSAKIGLMVNFFISYEANNIPVPAILQMKGMVDYASSKIGEKFKFNVRTQKGMLMPYDLSMTGYFDRKIEVDLGGNDKFASAKGWIVSDITDYLSKDVEGYDILVPIISIAPPEQLSDDGEFSTGDYAKTYPIGANTVTVNGVNSVTGEYYWLALASLVTPFIYMFCRIE